MDSSQLDMMIERAMAARDNAYAPYSNFRVGCSLLTEDGTVYTGCNVENASYGLTICAERTALVKAVSEGHRKFQAIAVSTDLDCGVAPCGACRQFIAEFGHDWQVIMVKSRNESQVVSVRDVLPFAFDKSRLDENDLNNNRRKTELDLEVKLTIKD